MGNYSGLGDLIESAFRAHPIRFPLLLLVLGGGATGWLLFGAHTFGRAIGFAVVIAIVGAILLPIGVVVAIRRQRNPIILRCRRCGAESRAASRPFRIQRFPDVPYSYVTCSQCGADFTVDKHARLV